jgi:phosphatidylinositol glycan class K
MLFIVDTCQAASLYQKFYSPNVLAIGSSLVGEDSLSHHVDPAIGVYIIDRYTYYALEFLEHVTPTSNHTLGQFVSPSEKSCSLLTSRLKLVTLFNFSSKSVQNTCVFLLLAFVVTFSSETLTGSLLRISLVHKSALKWLQTR